MRKAAGDGLRTSTARSFQPLLYKEGLVLAVNIATKPGAWNSHFQRAVASTLMPVVYGDTPSKSIRDANIAKFNEFHRAMGRSSVPGAYLVELFPWMRHIPSRYGSISYIDLL